MDIVKTGSIKMERIEIFENMLKDILQKYETEKEEMDRIKAAGKEKTATYRQYMSNHMILAQIIALYRKYGLL